MAGLPTLSDDFYRFIWDGHVVRSGIDPFAFTPAEILSIHAPGMDSNLFSHLNSQQYHSVYPPILQGIFYLAVYLFPHSWTGSVVVMRLILLCGELLTFLFLFRIAKIFDLDKKIILLYALNPLVIMEITGNLHFEGLMIPFVLFSIVQFENHKYFSAGVSLAFSIAIKLIPAILIPYFLLKKNIRSSVSWILGISASSILLFYPLFTSSFRHGIGAGLSLYFQKFEFNASIYYIIRQIGFWIKGYNIIGQSGPALAFTSFILIILLAFYAQKKNLSVIYYSLGAFVIYLLLALIIHPWYAIPVLVFSLLAGYRFGILWSYLIFLTYSGYSQLTFNEPGFVVFIEYLFTFGLAAWELRNKYGKRLQSK